MIKQNNKPLSIRAQFILITYSFLIRFASFFIKRFPHPAPLLRYTKFVPFTFFNFKRYKTYQIELAGCTCTVHLPEGYSDLSEVDDILFYIHGGAWVFGHPSNYRHMADLMVKAGGFAMVLIDYPLAPKIQFPIAHDICLDAYKELATKFIDKDIYIGGDSAGAVMAFDIVQHTKKTRLCPVKAYLNAPVVDSRPFYHHDFMQNKHNSPLLDLVEPVVRFEMYLTRDNCFSERNSPVLSDLNNLPPILLQVGGIDPLYTSLVHFYKKLRRHSVDVELHIHAHMWHVSELFTNLPESRQSLKEAAMWISEKQAIEDCHYTKFYFEQDRKAS